MLYDRQAFVRQNPKLYQSIHMSSDEIYIYLLRQVFRGKYGGSIETSVDLGAYSSKEQAEQAAKKFMYSEVYHPDAPYVLYILPCVPNTDARVLPSSEGYFISVDTCLQEQ